jgi:hypothetical protein
MLKKVHTYQVIYGHIDCQAVAKYFLQIRQVLTQQFHYNEALACPSAFNKLID